MLSTSSTSRNPLDPPIAQIMNNRELTAEQLLVSTKTAIDSRASGPLVFGDPGRHFEVHSSVSFRSINAMTIEAPPNSAPASPPRLALTSASREDIYQLLGHEEMPSTSPQDQCDAASISALSSPAQHSSSRCRRASTSEISDYHHSALSSHNLPGSPPMPGGGVDAHALNRSTRSTPQSPLPRLLPGLLDPILLREHALRDDDSPCAFGKLRRNWRPNQYRARGRRRYIPTIDYGLPEDFSAYLLRLRVVYSFYLTLVRNSPRPWMHHSRTA